jgi:hypothetical protein
MADDNPMRQHIGDLTEDEVRAIIGHLQFCERLARQVNPDYEPEDGPGELAERLDHLLYRARRSQAVADLQAGQCDGAVDGEECWLVMGHEGDHKPRSEVDPES